MKKTKKILLVGLNIFKDNKEPKISYTIGSLAAPLSQDKNIKTFIEDFDVQCFRENYEVETIITSLQKYKNEKIDYIGVSVFCWSSVFIKQLLKELKNMFPKSKIIVGGPEITYSTDEELYTDFPYADFYVLGYGENALLNIINGKEKNKKIYGVFNAESYYSPYLTGVIPLEPGQGRVRLETSRGCLFRCRFCAHFDKNMQQSIIYKNWKTIEKELELLINAYKVKRINVLDPIFNTKNGYFYKFVELLKSYPYHPEITLQVRPELFEENQIKSLNDLNIHLELGIQTLNKETEKAIHRRNNHKKIEKVLNWLNKYNISYEVSLIFGLPYQSLNTLKNTVSFLTNNGTKNIKIYPLALLRGTPLYNEREKHQFVTKRLSYLEPETVIASKYFSHREWLAMKEFANQFTYKTLLEK